MKFQAFSEKWTSQQETLQEQVDRIESHLLRILKRTESRPGEIKEHLLLVLSYPPEKSCLKTPTAYSVLPKVEAPPVVPSNARATANWTIITIPNAAENLRIGDVPA